MKKGETRTKIRWGDYNNLNDFMICVQILSRGGWHIRADLRRIASRELVKPVWKLTIWWMFPETINNKMIVFDGCSYLEKIYLTEKSGKKALKGIEENIVRATAYWKKVDVSINKIGDTIHFN